MIKIVEDREKNAVGPKIKANLQQNREGKRRPRIVTGTAVGYGGDASVPYNAVAPEAGKTRALENIKEEAYLSQHTGGVNQHVYDHRAM